MKNKSSTATSLKVSFAKEPPQFIQWGRMNYDTIPLALAVNDKGEVCRLEFAAGQSEKAILSAWKKKWPKTRFEHNPKAINPMAKKILKGEELNLRMIGTEFQCEVWRNLLKIPAGEVVTYAELARRSKRPKAVRAVGTACGANPVPILVPCHRVVGSNGGLGGFGGGLPTKKKLLKAEGFQQF